MPLQSQLFRGDSKLEAASVSDSAHIAQGAMGEHVRKIQSALIRLDGATITADGSYGAKTSAAVLAYKKKRNIINFSYQREADNIVGKMTMAALDAELVADELKPVIILPITPGPHVQPKSARNGLLLSFSLGDSLRLQLGATPVNPPVSIQPTIQVIHTVGGKGTIQVQQGIGGTLFRVQVETLVGKSTTKNPFQVARLVGAKVSGVDNEEVDVKLDPEMFTFDCLNCGQTFFQVKGFPSPTKRSAVLHLLVLVGSAGPSTEASRRPAPGFKDGLVSEIAGTFGGAPLNPLPGPKINLFGEGEAPGFEDYSSDINHCTGQRSRGLVSGNIHRPWTADSRRPPGIADHDVTNIFSRGSPIKDVTIEEIKRIAKSGCRVTYTEASGKRNIDILRAAFITSGLATFVAEGPIGEGGNSIVFKMN
ncbi:MAG TPA: peptidoglycan-binding protein [Bryobacteraceae bacterium]|nr:peptidoglycan-binding protein [Bryobacteraceae bacterium]